VIRFGLGTLDRRHYPASTLRMMLAGAVFVEARAQTDERVFDPSRAPGFNRKELLKFRKILVRSWSMIESPMSRRTISRRTNCAWNWCLELSPA
jgi:hypothetical protein